MNCDLCPEGEANVAAMGLPGGPMFCDTCLAAILLQLRKEDSLRRILATICAHRKEAKSHD